MNPFDEFDVKAPQANPFDEFDVPTDQGAEAPVLQGYSNDQGEIIPENPLPDLPADMPRSSGNAFKDYMDRRGQTYTPVATPEAAASDQAEIEAARAEPTPVQTKVDPLQSNSDLYGRIENDPKYQPVRDYEASFPRNIAGFGGGIYDSMFRPDDITDLAQQQEKEKMKVYVGTGEESSIFGIPVRTQEKRTVGPDGQMDSSRYLVDPPETNAFERMAYQVLRNVGAGVGDFVTEGKLTGVGAVGEALPNTVPNHIGEKFATDIATYAIGGAAAEKLVVGGGGALFNRMATMMSPEAKAAIRTTYTHALEATGNEQLARQAATQAANGVIAGIGLGIRENKIVKGLGVAARSANLGVAEGVVSPDDATGAVVDPEYFQKNWGVSEERAKDLSFLVDSPVMGATLATFGGIRNALVDKVVTPAFGGLRNMRPIGINANALPGLRMGDKAAGVKFMTWLDNGIESSSPEQAIHRMKLLADTINRHGEKAMKLGNASKAIKQDTAASFNEVAEDYFSLAYADQKAIMDGHSPGSFDKWVKDRAAEASMKMYKLRTVLGSETKSAEGVKELQGLLDDAADTISPGKTLKEAQGEAAEVAGQKNISDMETPQISAQESMTEAQNARTTADNAMTNDPEFGAELRKANNTLGSTAENQRIVDERLNPKVLAAQTQLKKDSDEAYKAIADTGAEGDPVSLLRTIRETGEVGPGEWPMGEVAGKMMGPPSPKVTLNDPFLKQIAESVEADPSIGNIYNNVRNQISDQISAAQKAGDPQGRLQTLYKLRDDINGHQLDHVAEGGDDNIKKMVTDAKDKYVKYQNAFYGPKNSALQSIADDGEQIIKSGESRVKRGQSDYDIGISRYVNNNLMTNERKTYARDLEHAASEGGQDIRPDIDNLYLGKAINNLSDSLARGGKQSVGTLRSDLRGIIENLERTDHPMVQTFRNMEEKIKGLDATASGKEAVAQEMKAAADEMTKNAQASIFNRFVTKSRNGPIPVEGGDFAKNVETIFNGKNGVSNVKSMMKEIDEMGEAGNVIREATQGTYIRWLQNKITGGQKIDMVAPDLGFAKRANDNQIGKLFDDDGHDFAVMSEVFKDKPELVDGLKSLSDMYLRLSKKTPKVERDLLFSKPDAGQDPQRATSTLITVLLGQLNPRATKARRLINPMTVDSLKEVEANMTSLVHMMTEDPEFASGLMKSIISDKVSKQQRIQAGEILRRATFRAYQSDDQRGFVPAAHAVEDTFWGGVDGAKGIMTKLK